MTIITHFAVEEVKNKCVAIVRFGPPGGAGEGFRTGEFYQVTIDPQKVSPTGEYIRFGTSPGDEIIGWQKASALTVMEILGDWDGGESPVLQYGSGVSMMIKERN